MFQIPLIVMKRPVRNLQLIFMYRMWQEKNSNNKKKRSIYKHCVHDAETNFDRIRLRLKIKAFGFSFSLFFFFFCFCFCSVCRLKVKGGQIIEKLNIINI